MSSLSTVEMCAGAGGQALGLESAGFSHAVAVEIDPDACESLRKNRPAWDVRCEDLRTFDGRPFRGIDLLAGGVPCPPFSVAGRQLGAQDERDLFPEVIRLVSEMKPRAILIENVRGLASEKFAPYRGVILERLYRLGYECEWRLLNASDFGTPQLRPRFILVGRSKSLKIPFRWPDPVSKQTTVADSISDIMGSRGWKGVRRWKKLANAVAPTIVGGSKKHGGPDLGPTRAKRQWASLGVDGMGIANLPPDADFDPLGLPRLTNRMVARLQGFPDSWQFHGGKTAQYRQIGNAFPPPVACAVGLALRAALLETKSRPRNAALELGPLFDWGSAVQAAGA